MSDLAKKGDVFFFGQFKADVSRGELEKSGNRVHLQEKPFRVLAILLESPNEPVSREALRNRLWSSDTFVEFDNGLNAAVKKLRIALGDSAEAPLYVETIPRRGYRFIAPVSRQPAERRQVPTAPAPPPISTKKALARKWMFIAAAAMFLLILASGFALRTHRAASSRITSIAVLPLENLSLDEEQAFFADGVTDELITDLAKTGALRVIARSSTARYRGTQKKVGEIARELGVEAIIEGSVSHSDDRILIRAQLIRVEPEQHLWAESFERSRRDLVVLQEELARDIAEAVRIKLRPQQEVEFAKERKQDPEAHELYLKGRYFWNKRTLDGTRKARAYFEQAIKKDPQYAQAYAGLADAYAFSGTDLPIKVAAMKSRQMAEKALELDPQLAEAHASLGLVAPQFGWDWHDADFHLRRAEELNPGYATAYQWHAEVFFATMGRMDEAIAEMKKAQQLDPLSAIIASDVGKMLLYARRYDDAEVELNKALDLDPSFSVAHALLSGVYYYKGNYSSSREELEKARSGISQADYLSGLIALDLKTSRKQDAQKKLNDLIAMSRYQPIDLGLIAELYAQLGKPDLAIQWLDRACNSGTVVVGGLNTNVSWDPLRTDPRFDAIRRKVRIN